MDDGKIGTGKPDQFDGVKTQGFPVKFTPTNQSSELTDPAAPQESDWAEPLVDPTDLVQQLVEVRGFDVSFFVEKHGEIPGNYYCYMYIYIMFIW